MKQSLMLAAALFFGCATGAVFRDVIVPPARAQGDTGPTYEYKQVELDVGIGSHSSKELEKLLPRFGAEGWHLAHVLTFEGGSPRFVIFERVRRTPAASPSPQP